MIKRFLYAVKQGWQHRNRLRAFRTHADLQVKTVLDLDLQALKKMGIKVLALDLDGVLVPHGETQLAIAIVDWLNNCIEIWTSANIFIYSNQPSYKRKQYFLLHFPGLNFIEGVRKKPYPDGLYHIMTQQQVFASDILLVDDRLLTGILASIIAGTKAKWVTKPFISLCKRPITELFFIFLRALERFMLR